MAQRILFVDDERDIVDIARVYLQGAGYEFEGAHDGLQAIQAVGEHRPDLIILDVQMPRLNGWDTLRILQDGEGTKDIPVLMLTAQSQDADRAKGWDLGVTWYHTKPFVFDDLLVVIKRILESTNLE
jgi:DNA-binding response OmpR family regulator